MNRKRNFNFDVLKGIAIISVVFVSDDFFKSYNEENTYWRGQYIDTMKPVPDKNGQVPVFTPEGKYVSQDCRHLTRSGAKLCSRLIDIVKYLTETSRK